MALSGLICMILSYFNEGGRGPSIFREGGESGSRTRFGV